MWQNFFNAGNIAQVTRFSTFNGKPVSVSDSITLSDSTSLTLYPTNISIGVSDSISLSDAAGIVPTSFNFSDTITLSDSASIIIGAPSLTYSIITEPTQVCANLTNYPLRFGVNDGSYPWMATTVYGGNVQSFLGYDITFTSDFAGLISIPFERVFWDPVTGNCKFYVLIASLSSTLNTVVFVHVGNPTIVTDQQNPPGVWTPAGYQLVQHFANGSVLSVTDSTNQNTCTNHGATAASGYDGQGCASFDGTDDYIDDGSNSVIHLNGSNGTIETWIDIASGAGSNHTILSNSDGNSGYILYINASDSRQEPAFVLFNNGSQSSAVSDYHNAIGAGWLYFVGTWKYNVGSSGVIFINGVKRGSDSTSGSFIVGTTTANLTIGSTNTAILLSEVRIANLVLSDCWISTVWNNLKNSSTFYTISNIPTGAVVSQYFLELGFIPNPGAAVSQYALELAIFPDAGAAISQYVLEAAYIYPPIVGKGGGWKLKEV